MDVRMDPNSLPSSESPQAPDRAVVSQGVPLQELKRETKATQEKPATAFGEKDLKELFRKAEEMSRIFGRDLKFRYQKDAELYQVEVVDQQDQKVIRKIPPDEIVSLIENINEMLGALFDKKF